MGSSVGKGAPSRRLTGVSLAVILLALLVLATADGVLPRPSETTVEVQALWYGAPTDRPARGGVTPVRITAVDDDQAGLFSLDLRGLGTAGAGAMWTAATVNAAVQAVLMSGADPRSVGLRYSLQEVLDGPSAGGLMAVGTLAAIVDAGIAADTTMTGTVLPDGSVGTVSGLADKLRAAGAAGFAKVLVPAGPSEVLDPSTGSILSLADAATDAGVEAVPVSSIAQAYGVLTGRPTDVDRAGLPAIDPRLLEALRRRSVALADTAEAGIRELSAGGAAAPAGSREQTELATVMELLTAAAAARASGDDVLAFSAAAEAAQGERQLTASVQLRNSASGLSLPERVARVRREATSVRDRTVADLKAVSELPLTMVEQLPALSDALAWGVFGLTSADVVLQRLDSVTTDGGLDELARFLAVARFEADVYMAVCAESVAFVGARSIGDVADLASMYDAYSSFLDYASDANHAYARSLGSADAESSYLAQLIAGSDALSGSLPSGLSDLAGPTAAPALRMAAALLDYVETTQLVNDLTARGHTGDDRPPNLDPIKDPAEVQRQSRVADEIATSQSRAIASVGMDPSYVRWNSQWGADVALGRLPRATDERILHGLQFQWFAVLQSRLVMALSGAQSAEQSPAQG